MTGCWWPCCSETYNLRKYDRDGAILWSATIDDGNTIIQLQSLGSQYLYSLTLFTGTNAGVCIAKHDVTSSPVIVWDKTFSQIKAIRPEAAYFHPVRIAIDGSGNVICLMQYGVSFPQGNYFAIKLRASDGALLWQRELSHTIVSTGQKIYWDPRDVACDSSGNSYYACNGVRLEKSGPTLALWQYINLVALNSDSSNKWRASTDLTEATVGYPSTYQPPNLASIDTDGTRVYWATNTSPFTTPVMLSIGANLCSDGSAVWDDESGKTSWPVIVNSNASDSVIHLYRDGSTTKIRTRSSSTGVAADTISPTSGAAFIPAHITSTSLTGTFSGRRAAGAVARLILLENYSATSGKYRASVWEDIQAGASVYTKIHTLDYGGDVNNVAIPGPQCVAYQHIAGPNDNVFAGGPLVNA